ncbi:MAG: YebC/PmpR family DNA-binding transcriptional regulator [Candidatus Wildermuthbacteria bacterium]|nr:YebC/PmpR family DNA-binding transcriptional regulator [Candidatus Wildermuthbacteria bacterium]
MSGHSHAKTIKHKKDATDAQRSKVFSKLSSEIVIAVKEGGEDPAANPRLRMAIDKARSCNMPTANIDRSIKKGTGEEAGGNLEQILFEGYGPGGFAALVEGITDNKNRASGELKQIFEKNGGKLTQEGAVRWMFDRVGTLQAKPGNLSKEDMELLAIEAGAQDIAWKEDGLCELQVPPGETESVRSKLRERGVEIDASALAWTAKETIRLSPEDRLSAERFFEALDENDAVQEIYSNLAE